MKTLHALLTAIDAYPMCPLRGCVNDCLAFDEFLRRYAKQAGYEYRPLYLLAPHDKDAPGVVQKIGDGWGAPTRANIIDGFQKHLAAADDDNGDLCVFYYSGHGSQEPAAPEFRHLKSDGMNETLVCVDSRVRGGRDLVDKELAWLLWRVTYGKPYLHFLVVTDCCHSGNNTRSALSPAVALVSEEIEAVPDVRSRRLDARSAGTPFAELEGVRGLDERTEKLFEIRDGKAYYRTNGRYVALAAARDTETAKELGIEGRQRGAFTWSLVRVLEQGGVAMSYRELIRRVEALVRNRVAEQIPQLDATVKELANTPFLGGKLGALTPAFPITFTENEWRLQAGALNGVVRGSAGVPTRVRLADQRECAVLDVFADYAVLEPAPFVAADRDRTDLAATLLQLPAPRVKIFLDPAMPAAARQTLEKMLAASPRLFHIDCSVKKPAEAEYIAGYDGDEYLLVRPGSAYPVFKRTADAGTFLTNCNTIGKWRHAVEMQHAESKIDRKSFELEFELIEGQRVARDTINTLTGVVKKDPTAVELRYKTEGDKMRAPALRLRVRALRDGLYFGALYLDSLYGITDLGSPRQLRKGEEHVFEFEISGTNYNAIPLQVSEDYLKLGIGEIRDYVKVLASTTSFTLDDFRQSPLQLDTERLKGTRAAGFDEEENEAPNRPDWLAVTVPVTLIRPLAAGAANGFRAAGFRLTTPEGLSATAATTTPAEVQRKFAAATRALGADDEAALKATVLPPASLWGTITATEGAFTRSVEAPADAQLSVLELTDVHLDGDGLSGPLRLELDEPLADDEALVPFGYDAASGLYLPLGETVDDRTVHIHTLPAETPGRLAAEGTLTDRSLGGSIKLFFKKVFKKELANTLAWWKDGNTATSDAAAIRQKLADPACANVLLLVHGIIGDTEGQKNAVFFQTDVHTRFDAVLTFDYENLNTDLRLTAKDLFQRLQAAGLTAVEQKRLTIVAHSMGGLVSRRMIEFEGAAPYVQQLVMVGTPNAGSDLSEFRKRAFGLLGHALNGVSLLKPYIIPLTFLAKKTEKALFFTLDQMHPANSDFLRELNDPGRPVPGVRYRLLAGDTHDIGAGTDETDGFWTRFRKLASMHSVYSVLDWGVFDAHNDIAVEVSSQRGWPWVEDDAVSVLPCDHISYFVQDNSLRRLSEVLTADRAEALAGG